MTIPTTRGNRVLDWARDAKSDSTYGALLSQLVEHVLNDLERMLEVYYQQEIADAITVLGRLSRLELAPSGVDV